MSSHWKTTLRTQFHMYLLDNLNVKGIVDPLLANSLITESLYTEIRAKVAIKNANSLYMDHLNNSGAKGTFVTFVHILADSSNEYPVHGEIVRELKEDPVLGPILQDIDVPNTIPSRPVSNGVRPYISGRSYCIGGSVATWTCIIVVVGVAVVIPIFCTRARDSGFCSKIPQIFPSNGKPGEGTLDNGKVSPGKSNEYGNSKGRTNKEIKKCDSWNDCLEKNYFSYLTDKLNVKGIVIRLREGGLISWELQDEIEGTRSGHEANALYIKHLIRNGIKDTFRTFVNILRDSSEEFNIHGEIASTFRQDPMLNTVLTVED